MILGSFPSVKSRLTGFYYGNKQNRFWKMLSAFFGEEVGSSPSERRAFVLARGIALWDIVTECEIVGSADASISRYSVAPVEEVLSASHVSLILLNGKRAYEIFCERYADVAVPYLLMPSTSPANPRYDGETWFGALRSVFTQGEKP